MIVEFYNLSKRYNSLKVPANEGEKVEVKLKSDTSKFSPSFTLQLSIKPSWNYFKYDDLYYYVTDITTVHDNIYIIDGEIDVLASYRNQIRSTSAYIRYSSSDYDMFIPDDRVSVGSDVTFRVSTHNLFTPIPVGNQILSGTYVVNYVTTEGTIGPSGCLWLTNKQAIALSKVLSNGGFLNSMFNVPVGDLITKSLENVYDAVISCKYIPMDLTPFVSSSNNTRLLLGAYDTGIKGTTPTTSIYYRFELNIPKPYSDYRQLSPYTEYYFVLPGVGIVPYNANLLINRTSISIGAFIDGITGDIVYVIDDTTRVTGNIATTISLSKLSNPGAVAGAAGVVTGVAAAATGHVGVAAASLFGATVSSAQVSTGTVGGLTSNINAFLTTASVGLGQAGLVALSRGTNVDPDTTLDTIGRPCHQTKLLADLDGYVQTVDASVECNAPISIKEQINNYLNGGIYLE